MKNPIKVISNPEVEALFQGITTEYLDKNRPVAWSRYRLLILFMLHAGLRIGETVQLLWSDVIMNNTACQSVLVRSDISKSKERRSVPMNEHLQKAVIDFFNHWILSNPPSLDFYIFQARFPDRHITVRQVQQWLARMSETYCGVHITPHMLRHTFATRMMSYTSASTVQAMLGHKRLSSTQIYMHVTMRHCIDAVSSQKSL